MSCNLNFKPEQTLPPLRRSCQSAFHSEELRHSPQLYSQSHCSKAQSLVLNLSQPGRLQKQSKDSDQDSFLLFPSKKRKTKPSNNTKILKQTVTYWIVLLLKRCIKPSTPGACDYDFIWKAFGLGMQLGG